MQIITGKRVAEIYFSMERHFENTGYSITEYSWHPINIPLNRYLKKFPVQYCQILGNEVKKENKLFDLLIPSFAERTWYMVDFVEDLDNRKQLSLLWKDRIAAVKYDFSKSIYDIIHDDIKLDSKFSDYILDLYVNDQMNLEILCIWSLMMNLDFTNNFIWNKTSLGDKVQAYTKLVQFNIPKYKKIFIKIMKENA